MYYSVYGKNLVDEPFVKWDNGPVSMEVYKGYRYGDLDRNTSRLSDITNKLVVQVLNIVNYVYAYLSGYELSEESHKISIWRDAKKNDCLRFENLSENEKKYMNSIFNMNKDIDFDNIGVEKINDNMYYYDKNNMKLDDEIIQELSAIPKSPDKVTFLEMIDGELVFS